jgi:hypothetical protein
MDVVRSSAQRQLCRFVRCAAGTREHCGLNAKENDMNERKMRWSLGLTAVLTVAAVAFVCLPAARPQGESQTPIYTYVSQFAVPRASWAQYTADEDKNFLPVANKMLADGTIISYSTFETIVHTEGGMTNGAAWSSPTISGLMKMLEALRKNAPSPGQISSTKHEDFLMVTNMYEANPNDKSTTGYLRVVCQNAKPENLETYATTLKKYLWPTVQEQVKAGVASYAGLDSQYVNTGAPSIRCVVINYPNAEAMDKWAKAIGAVLSQSGTAEALQAAVVPDSRRDFLARITHMAHK